MIYTVEEDYNPNPNFVPDGQYMGKVIETKETLDKNGREIFQITWELENVKTFIHTIKFNDDNAVVRGIAKKHLDQCAYALLGITPTKDMDIDTDNFLHKEALVTIKNSKGYTNISYIKRIDETEKVTNREEDINPSQFDLNDTISF